METENRNAELHRALVSLLAADLQALQTQLDELGKAADQMSEERQAEIRALTQRAASLMEDMTRLQRDLADPQKISERLRPVLGVVFEEEVQREPEIYTDAIAPIISPAIREQIRNNRADMIAALYPIIGQTIGTAVAQAMQDLRRRIDANLKQSFNIRQQLYRISARMRGVSEADLLLRDALPYQVTNVFLIHKKTGLLLEQLSSTTDKQDMDMISAMLSAIRDFAHDALGTGESDLDEIQYGNSRILLKASQWVYLAAVVQGSEPGGYSTLMQQVAHDVNSRHESALRRFAGEMEALPDFKPLLQPLLEPAEHIGKINVAQSSLTGSQKMALGLGAGGLAVFLALLVFGCVFTYRLLPVAFPAPSATVLPPTLTLTLTTTPSPTLTATFTPTLTASPTFTATLTPTITKTPLVVRGVMTGNVWVKPKPDPLARNYSLVITAKTPVEILAVYGAWAKVAWTSEFGAQEGWVPLRWVGTTDTIPKALITPQP